MREAQKYRCVIRPKAILALGALLWTGLGPPAAAQTGKWLATFSDWSSYMAEEPKGKICFAASQPKSQEPKNLNREPPFFYISAWPREGVKSEVSIKIGYPFKKGSEATVTVGSTAFKLFTQNDRAFVGDAAQEQKLIEAMKKGSTMQVQGTSERGTMVTDTFSLSGLAQAMQSLSECR
jgi:uracil-DNA glycosylase